MIKLIQCLRSRPELSIDEFRGYWKEYEGLVRTVVEESRALQFSMSTYLAVDLNMQVLTARGTRPPYDGVVEIWWQTGAGIMDDLGDPRIQAGMAAMQKLQPQFADLEESTIFFAAEDVVEQL